MEVAGICHPSQADSRLGPRTPAVLNHGIHPVNHRPPCAHDLCYIWLLPTARMRARGQPHTSGPELVFPASLMQPPGHPPLILHRQLQPLQVVPDSATPPLDFLLVPGLHFQHICMGQRMETRSAMRALAKRA